jgi:hypothetical protein
MATASLQPTSADVSYPFLFGTGIGMSKTPELRGRVGVLACVPFALAFTLD